MIHLSDIKKYERCTKLYWLSQKQPKVFFPFVYYNESMIELCKELLMLSTYFEGKSNDDPRLALDALQTSDVLVTARFAYGELRIKIPFMVRDESGWNLYFTYSTCYPKESEAQYIADIISVLELLAIEVHRVFIIHLNADYVRQGILDVHQLFCISEYLFNLKNHANHKVLELVEHKKRDVMSFAIKLQETMRLDGIETQRSNNCTRGNKCMYYDTCFPVPEASTSIMNLMQSAKKYELAAKGILDIKDVDIDMIEGTRHQYAQIMAAKNEGIYMDAYAVSHWVEHSISYPISYLDFEWETYAYPPYDGMKPYDVLVFQYSLHVEKHHKAQLEHFEYLGTKDCRIAFIEHLLRDIPKKGSILVFNMEGAEKLRLKQLSEQFPQYKKELDALCARMVDLSLPFSTGNIYDSRMEGYYSLKKLVQVFSDYSYQNLDISYGMEAVRAWRLLENLEEEESNELQKALYSYCEMDTYAEVIVFHKIVEFLEERGIV